VIPKDIDRATYGFKPQHDKNSVEYL